jgi:hypothetical protein
MRKNNPQKSLSFSSEFNKRLGWNSDSIQVSHLLVYSSLPSGSSVVKKLKFLNLSGLVIRASVAYTIKKAVSQKPPFLTN